MHHDTQASTDTNQRTRAPKVPVVPAARCLDESDTSRYTGYSRSWLRQRRMHGEGPPYYRVGRSVRYLVADLDRWLEQHRVETAA